MFRSRLLSIGLALLIPAFVVGCAPSEDASSDSATDSAASAYDFTLSDAGEGWISMSSDGNLMVFGRHDDNWSAHTLWGAERAEEWGEAAVLPFSGTFNDRGARFYPGLDALIFASDRPLPGEAEAGDFNLWIVVHDGIEWLDPEPMASLNSDQNDFHPSVAADGSIFFASSREGGQGRSDLYRAELGIEGYEVAPVPGAINTELSEPDVWINPDMQYMIFARTEDPAGLGGDDLFISFPGEDGWGAPIHLGSDVNSAEYEYGPYVTGDGETLFFTTHRDGDADILSIPMSSLDIAWPEGM